MAGVMKGDVGGLLQTGAERAEAAGGICISGLYLGCMKFMGLITHYCFVFE